MKGLAFISITLSPIERVENGIELLVERYDPNVMAMKIETSIAQEDGRFTGSSTIKKHAADFRRISTARLPIAWY